MAIEGGSSLRTLASLQVQEKQQCDRCVSPAHARPCAGCAGRAGQAGTELDANLLLMPGGEFSVSVLHLLERIATCTQFQQCVQHLFLVHA